MKKTTIIDGVEYELTPVTKKQLVIKKEIHLEIHPVASYRMTWDEANAAIKDLGEGWRFPTIGEFFIINESNSHEDFRYKDYWGAKLDRLNARYFCFDIGSVFGTYRDNANYVLAVREITSTK